MRDGRRGGEWRWLLALVVARRVRRHRAAAQPIPATRVPGLRGVALGLSRWAATVLLSVGIEEWFRFNRVRVARTGAAYLLRAAANRWPRLGRLIPADRRKATSRSGRAGAGASHLSIGATARSRTRHPTSRTRSKL